MLKGSMKCKNERVKDVDASQVQVEEVEMSKQVCWCVDAIVFA